MFWVAGVPQPQGSTKSFKIGTKIITTSANKQLRPWRHAVSSDAQTAHQATGDGQAMRGAVALYLEFYFARPKGHYGVHGLLPSAPKFHITKPDVSKLIRAIEDSLVDAGVLRDDNQVVLEVASKSFSDEVRPPGAQIRIVDCNG